MFQRKVNNVPPLCSIKLLPSLSPLWRQFGFSWIWLDLNPLLAHWGLCFITYVFQLPKTVEGNFLKENIPFPLSNHWVVSFSPGSSASRHFIFVLLVQNIFRKQKYFKWTSCSYVFLYACLLFFSLPYFWVTVEVFGVCTEPEDFFGSATYCVLLASLLLCSRTANIILLFINRRDSRNWWAFWSIKSIMFFMIKVLFQKFSP